MEENRRSSGKGKIGYTLFVVALFAAAVFGAYYLINNIGSESYDFSKDGYAVMLGEEDNKIETYAFNSGTEYKYRKIDGKISFISKNGIVGVPDDTIIHYADSSLLTLKKMVGIDLKNINDEVVLYYNIFKNTTIGYANDLYRVTTNDGTVDFENLLLRVDTNKFLLTGSSVRLSLNEEIVDFGKYAYFEYAAGSVVKVYNEGKFYQTISKDAALVVDDIVIDLYTEEIAKAGKKYITLTNLVLDQDGNIDLIANNDKEALTLPNIDNSEVATPALIEGNETGATNVEETVVDETVILKQPTLKVTRMDLSGIKLDADIEVTDDSALISSAITTKVVENATYTTVCEQESTPGDVEITVFCVNLIPDTEYTLISEGSFVLDDLEYDRQFLSKIFRTESLGLVMEKSYATKNSVVVKLTRDDYSKVSSVGLALLNSNGSRIDMTTVGFSNSNEQEIEFKNLTPDTDYTVRMFDVVSEGMVVDDGYSETMAVKTLKGAPTVGDLQYEVDKRNAQFVLSVAGVTDTYHGVNEYRYDVYDARQMGGAPLMSFTKSDLSSLRIDVPDRGVPYTYTFTVIYYDNEKIVEYSKELDTTMILNGVNFPTLDFVVNTNLNDGEQGVTWEQINGSIVVSDPYHTVRSERFKVVYKNSLGIEKTITVDATADGDDYALPIAVNNLRQNDTYVFKVYGKVDLQDGNVAADETAIGNVYVDTKDPQEFVAHFTPVDDNRVSLTTPFAFTFQLSGKNGENVDLEASTLASMTFTLYEGTTTDGAVVTYRPVADTNSADYESTLKTEYYDNSVLITPDFFYMSNNDFTNKTYMVKVDNARDYTTYQNNFVINDNEYAFEITNFLPPVSDPDNAISVVAVANKNAAAFGLAYDNSLDANTTVGYNVLANYNNVSGDAEYVLYHVMVLDSVTGEYAELTDIPETERKVYFGEDGQIAWHTFALDKGTAGEHTDYDKMRRGNQYRFTYEIYLHNGNRYPDILYNEGDEIPVLKSQTVLPKKQEASFVMYPYNSGTNWADWKYKYVDQDKALVNNELYAFVGENSVYSSTANVTVNENFQVARFSTLEVGKAYSIKKQELLMKSGNTTTTTLNAQWFYGYSDNLGLSYTVTPDVNVLKIKIAESTYYTPAVQALFNKIAAVQVRITPVEAGIDATTIDAELDGNTITIDYYDITNYLDVNVRVDVIAYFDTGRTGYGLVTENSAEHQLLQQSTSTSSNNYYCLEEGGNLTLSLKSYGCMYSVINLNTTRLDDLALTSAGGASKNLAVQVAASGITYTAGSAVVVPREVQAEELSCSDKVVEFTKIIPGLSMLDDNGKTRIVSFLNGAEMSPTFVNPSGALASNDPVYAEIYATDEFGRLTSETPFRTVTFTAGQMAVASSTALRIEDLEPSENFMVKFFYDDCTSGICEKQYLYDIDTKRVGEGYLFNTLASVGIGNVRLELISESYSSRELKLSYTLERVSGYDNIVYKVEKWVGSEYRDCSATSAYCNVAFATSTTFLPMMSVSVSAAPGSGIAWGDKYRITLTPIGSYVDTNGDTISLSVGEVQEEITIARYSNPYMGLVVSKLLDGGGVISANVSLHDSDHVIVNDEYSVVLMNSTLTDVQCRPTSTTTADYGMKYLFANGAMYTESNGVTRRRCTLTQGKTYYVVMTANYDTHNSGEDFVAQVKQRIVVYDDTPNAGTLTARKSDNGNNYIDIIFSEAYKLANMDYITYTVSSETTGQVVTSYTTGDGEFVPRYDVETNLWYYTLSVNNAGASGFTPGGLYLVTINFYYDNDLVDEKEVTYYYED